MHYIIGTQVSVKEFRDATPARVTVIGEPQRRIKNKNLSPFKSNTVYTLNNIKVSDTGLIYCFRSTQGDEINLPFKTSKQADGYIANVRGDTLPDYDNFFRRSTG